MTAEHLRELAEAATPGPWRVRRAPLDRDYLDAPPTCYGIAAGSEKWHHNKGWFHPDDAKYPVDETFVVEIGYDRDYHTPQAAIPRAEDAAFIAACDPSTIQAILDERDQLRKEVERLNAENISVHEKADEFVELRLAKEAAERHAEKLADALEGIAENGACASDGRVAKEALADYHSKEVS